MYMKCRVKGKGRGEESVKNRLDRNGEKVGVPYERHKRRGEETMNEVKRYRRR